jgi:hypothetical protein
MKTTLLILTLAAATLAQAQESAYEKYKRESDAYLAWSEASTAQAAAFNAANRQREQAEKTAAELRELQEKVREQEVRLTNHELGLE